MSKGDKKIDIVINNTDYKQIRTESKDITWKNVPLVEDNVFASGLHIVSEHPERNHYDYCVGNKKIFDLLTNEGLSGVFLRKGGGEFAVPSNKIIVLTGKGGKPTFISPHIYEENKEKYRIVLKNKRGQVCVVAIK